MAEKVRVLAGHKRADGRTAASSLLQRLSDADDDGLPEQVIEPLLAAVLDAGDDISVVVARTALPFDLDQHRVSRLVRRFLQRLAPQRREHVLKQDFARGRAIVTMVRELAFLGRQHGLWGGKQNEGAERWLTLEAVSQLQSILLERIRSVGADSSLWTSGQPITLLDAWRVFGEEQEMRHLVAEHLQADGALLEFLRGFIINVRSSGVTDRVARVTPRIDPDPIAEFASIEDLERRAQALTGRNNLASEDAAALDAFLRGVAARKAGNDPTDLWDD